MAVPADQQYSTQAKINANTAIYNLLVASGTSGCTVKLYDSSDTLLVTVPLSDPPGSVDGGTGVLTLTASGSGTASAGTVAYGQVCDAGGTMVVEMPAQQGVAAVDRRVVLNYLNLLASAEVSLASITVGA